MEKKRNGEMEKVGDNNMEKKRKDEERRETERRRDRAD